MFFLFTHLKQKNAICLIFYEIENNGVYGFIRIVGLMIVKHLMTYMTYRYWLILTFLVIQCGYSLPN